MEGVLEPGILFVQEPFTTDAFILKINETLEVFMGDLDKDAHHD